MAKTSLNQRLKRLQELETEDDSPELRAVLRSALQDDSNRVVAKAAEIVGQRELIEFRDELRSLWPRFLSDPLESDKGCHAKTAILDALSQLGFDDPDFYLDGIRYRQLEPGWPKASDTAINLRGSSAFALARSHLIGLRSKLIALTDLLADSERLARVHAVNALVDVGHDSVIPLLRVKARCGDGEAEVTGACLAGLLRLDLRESIPFVGQFLHGSESVVCEAAVALGECNHGDAVALLIQALDRTEESDLQESLLVAIGLSRHPSALDFLIGTLSPHTNFSEVGLRALAPSRFYPGIRERIEQAVRDSQSRRLMALFEDAFRL